MKRWYFCLYTAINYQKVENFLTNMEGKGYRLEKRVLNYFFKFKEKSAKKVNYFLTYSPAGGNVTMHDLEMRLRGEYNASIVVEQGFEAPRIYRICNTDKPILAIKKERDCSLKRICVDKFITELLFAIFMELVFVILKSDFGRDWPIHFVATLGIIFCSAYHFIQSIILARRIKNNHFDAEL